jgi:hypothetical protein
LDPCSYLERHGREKFIDLAKKSSSIIDEYMDYLKDKLIEKEISINEALDSFVSKIRYVQDYIQRDKFINKFAASFSISKVKIESIINKEFIRADSPKQSIPTNRILSPEDIILKVFVEFPDSRDSKSINKYISIISPGFYKEMSKILLENIEDEASLIIGKIQDSGMNAMFSDLIFIPFDVPVELSARVKLIKDCIRKIELNLIKDSKRLINLKLSKDVQISDEEEIELLNDLKNLIEEEKALT